MTRLKKFLVTSLIGGLTVILPLAITLGVFGWIFKFVARLIQPLTQMITAQADIKSFLASGIVIIFIGVLCFFVGILVKTGFGRFIHNFVDALLVKFIPGYNLIKETVTQMIGNDKSPFSSVALAQIFANETLVTSFVTEEHTDGSFSVFVPTGPNPTSGNIYHLSSEYVHPIDVPVEDAMRSIISCGAGSAKLMDLYRKKE